MYTIYAVNTYLIAQEIADEVEVRSARHHNIHHEDPRRLTTLQCLVDAVAGMRRDVLMCFRCFIQIDSDELEQGRGGGGLDLAGNVVFAAHAEGAGVRVHPHAGGQTGRGDRRDGS